MRCHERLMEIWLKHTGCSLLTSTRCHVDRELSHVVSMPLDFALIDQVNLLEYFCFVAIDKTTTDDTDEIPFLQKKNENDQSEARTNEPTKIRTRLKMYVIEILQLAINYRQSQGWLSARNLRNSNWQLSSQWVAENITAELLCTGHP